MELKLTKDYIAIVEVENPFKKKVSSGGIILAGGEYAMSDETGEMEKVEQVVRFGVVTLVGPDAKVVKVGDGVYYDQRTLRPIPFYEPIWMFNEGNIIGYVSDEDGSIASAISDYEQTRVSAAIQSKILHGGVDQFDGLKRVQ